jgi:hypothetical protein
MALIAAAAAAGANTAGEKRPSLTRRVSVSDASAPRQITVGVATACINSMFNLSDSEHCGSDRVLLHDESDGEESTFVLQGTRILRRLHGSTEHRRGECRPNVV